MLQSRRSKPPPGRLSSPLVLLLALSLASVSCVQHTFAVGTGAPDGEVVYEMWHHHWLFGLIRPELQNSVLVAKLCPSGNATIDKETTFLNGLVDVLIRFLYSPTTVTITCEDGTQTSIELDANEVAEIITDPLFLELVAELVPERLADIRAATQGSEGEAELELANGFGLSPIVHRAPMVDHGSCTGTVVDTDWVLTARHCLRDKDPNAHSVSLDGETRSITHVTLHPRHLERVDVAMLRLASPFTGIRGELNLFPGDTDELISDTVLCYGYGGSPTLRGGFFTVKSASGPPYYEGDMFYLLDSPNKYNRYHVPGDSGGSCKWGTYITGVQKGAGQVSAEAWYDWVTARRDCPGFDPNNPRTAFCSAACPCDVAEGDCDGSTQQCQPGLTCLHNAGPAYGLPYSYDVCDRIDPPLCGSRPVYHWEYCYRVAGANSCVCTHGQGDCDDDHDCGGSLECQRNSGFAVEQHQYMDICVYPAARGCPSYHPDVDDQGFCTAKCPCDLGQGDCDGHAQCRGSLRCMANVGLLFGKPAGYDMCVRPSLWRQRKDLHLGAAEGAQERVDLVDPANELSPR